jgi:hypothetical protein
VQLAFAAVMLLAIRRSRACARSEWQLRRSPDVRPASETEVEKRLPVRGRRGVSVTFPLRSVGMDACGGIAAANTPW